MSKKRPDSKVQAPRATLLASVSLIREDQGFLCLPDDDDAAGGGVARVRLRATTTTTTHARPTETMRVAQLLYLLAIDVHGVMRPLEVCQLNFAESHRVEQQHLSFESKHSTRLAGILP